MPDMAPRRKMLVSRALRRRSTYTESLAWNLLRNRRFLGLKFRRQYGIAGFVVDFYCPDLKLAIEIDGASHDGREGYDVWRQLLIEDEFISFVRVTMDELVSNPGALLERIHEVAKLRQRKSLTLRQAQRGAPNPSPRRTGAERGASPVDTIERHSL